MVYRYNFWGSQITRGRFRLKKRNNFKNPYAIIHRPISTRKSLSASLKNHSYMSATATWIPISRHLELESLSKHPFTYQLWSTYKKHSYHMDWESVHTIGSNKSDKGNAERSSLPSLCFAWTVYLRMTYNNRLRHT